MSSFHGNKIDIVGEGEVVTFLELVVAGSYVTNANPISFHTLLNSQSGAGKDFVIDKIKQCLDAKNYEDYTRISSKALDYLHANEPGWDWTGKILILHDIDNDILNSSTMKVFMSDGSNTAIVNDGKVIKRKIVGRPIIIMTSAFSDPEFEQLRRINIISLDESKEQTKKIMRHHCEIANKSKFDIKEPKCVQLQPHPVKIPFADELVELLGTDEIYMRTFFPRLLDFVKASAIIQFNQKERETDNDGYVIAEKEDYEFVRLAFNNNLSVGASFVPLSYSKKTLYKRLTEEYGLAWFTTKDVENVTSLSYEAMRKALSSLKEMGYLESHIEIGAYGKPTINYKIKEISKIKLKSIFTEGQ